MKLVSSYWNSNKSKFQQHYILRNKVLDSDRHLNPMRPSTFEKWCCPEGKMARAKRVPIWIALVCFLWTSAYAQVWRPDTRLTNQGDASVSTSIAVSEDSFD